LKEINVKSSALTDWRGVPTIKEAGDKTLVAIKQSDSKPVPARKRKRKTQDPIIKETKLEHKCPDCGAPLWVRGYGVFCKTPNCTFYPDDVLDYWKDMHEEYLE
jgi:hypothetical protein